LACAIKGDDLSKSQVIATLRFGILPQRCVGDFLVLGLTLNKVEKFTLSIGRKVYVVFEWWLDEPYIVAALASGSNLFGELGAAGLSWTERFSGHDSASLLGKIAP
jgi:hypothetical protein